MEKSWHALYVDMELNCFWSSLYACSHDCSSTYVVESKRAWSSHGAEHNLGSASASQQHACFLDQNIGRGCGKLPETLTLFQTKICDFSDAISDPTHTCSVLFRPDSVLKTGGPGGHGGYPTKCKGEAPPRVSLPAHAFPFLYHFEKKGIPFFIK